MTMTKAEILRGWTINRQVYDRLNFQKFLPRPKTVNFTIPVSSWVSEDGNFYADINVAGVTADDDAEIDFDSESWDLAANAVISTEGDSLSGKLRIYSKNIPTAEISGTVKITKGVTT